MRRFVVPALLLALPYFSACRPKDEAAAARSSTGPVAVIQAHGETRTAVIPLAGRVYNPQTAALVARVSGSIDSPRLRYGEAFSAGEEVIRIAAPEITARLHQAEARLAQAERDLAREERLRAQGVTPAETVLALAEQRTLATAAVREAQALVSHTSILAPFTGRVTAQHVQPGDTVLPGQPLVALEGEGALLVELSVPLSFPVLPVGQPVSVRIQQSELVATLIEVAPGRDAGSPHRQVRLELPPATVYPSGEYVEVLWPRGETTVLLLPAAAVRTEGEIDTVFLVRDGIVHTRLVRTVARSDGQREILSGLSASDQVIAEASPSLREGQIVTPQP